MNEGAGSESIVPGKILRVCEGAISGKGRLGWP